MPRRSRPDDRSFVLAIDLGTSSVRSALFDEMTRVVPGSRASQDYRVRYSVEHGAELDPAALLQATRRCLRQTQGSLAESCAPVIAGSGLWHSMLGVDRGGEPLTPIYTWADARSAEDAARLRKQLDERMIQQRTGCMLRASFWPARLAWFRRTRPRLFRRVACWVSPAEWIFEKNFGVTGCSHSMASGTGLYNLARRDWDAELLKVSGLTSRQLGPLRDTSDAIGKTIFSAIGDGAAGNLGSGAIRPGFVAINFGTSAAVRAVPSADASLPFGLFRFVIDQNRQLLGGAVSNAGNLRAWCRRELRLPDDERSLDQLLRTAGSGAARLTILPFWVGERAPTWPEDLTGTVVGLSQATTSADLLAAALTAVCLRLSEILEQVESAIGRARKIIVSGGILQSPASLQILADSLGRDLEVCADQEASLRGAAIHALEQLGHKIAAPKLRHRVRHNRAKASQTRAKRARQKALEALLSSWS